MKYIGLQSQIWRNNVKSTILLILFPTVLYALAWMFFFLNTRLFGISENPNMPKFEHSEFFEIPKKLSLYDINISFLHTVPWITLAVLIWFSVAYFTNTAMIEKATGSKFLSRKENKRVYNLVENLCISIGMQPPKINIIEDNSLNAFASGINRNTYTVSLSRGIINKLNDEELKSVIAHELTHIRNRDVRLLIISIIFVGIFAFLTELCLRIFRYGGRKSKKNGQILLIVLILAPIGYLLSSIFRFALSQKREYLADAGATEMTKHPDALASALKKISHDSRIEAVTRKDVAQLFIENPREKKSAFFSFQRLFSTHPPITKRIAILEQF